MAIPLVDDLLKKEMDRKDFLMHIGIGVLTLIGVMGILRGMSEHRGSSTARQSSSGYGGNGLSK